MRKHLPVVVIILLFFVVALRLANNSFYYDELYTLKSGICQPLPDVMFHYKNLNIHPLFTVLSNLEMTGRSFSDVLDHPWIIRLPQLLFPITTLWLTYSLGARIKSRRAGMIACAIMASTLPFYYYSSAIRGYQLSLMLYTAMLLCYFNRRYVILGTLTALFLYVMPSNAAFVAGLGTWTIIERSR